MQRIAQHEGREIRQVTLVTYVPVIPVLTRKGDTRGDKKAPR